MRPTLLDPLFADATTLPGIGPKLGKAVGRVYRRQDYRPVAPPAQQSD
jgi:hypothetical protein